MACRRRQALAGREHMRELWLRGGLLVLAAGGGGGGGGAGGGWGGVAAPRSFYDDFPGGGRHWVSALPEYNEHLIRDVGGLNLAVAPLLLAAAVVLERRLVQAALVAPLLYAVPHLIFHVAEAGELERTGDKVAQTLTLVLAVVIPLVLLPLTLRLGAAEHRS